MKFPRCWGFLPTRSTVTKEGQAARQAASGAQRAAKKEKNQEKVSERPGAQPQGARRAPTW